MNYAADETCEATWKALSEDPKAMLIDVRTTREWETIGIPDLSSIGKETIFNEWQKFPDMSVNAHFAEEVEETLSKAGSSKNDPIYFLCRSGARSQGAAAALTALGYSKAYNILAGFEGMPDASGVRGRVNGWQSDGLPWKRQHE